MMQAAVNTPQAPHALSVFVEGIGLLGPGLPSWAESSVQWQKGTLYQAARCVLPLPMALPPAERRRAGAVVKASLAVGQEAITASGRQAAELPSVFSSSTGDAINCHEICQALASNDRLISPTRFHNSVHNASSGYWSISSGSMASSSVLCAYDASFAAGLLEAMTQVVVEQKAVLLLAYDTDYPEPLRSVRPVSDTFAVGLVLAPQRTERSLAQWSLDPASCFSHAAADRLKDNALEQVRQTIPAARSLPLLCSVATQSANTVVLAYLDELQLAVQVLPCQ